MSSGRLGNNPSRKAEKLRACSPSAPLRQTEGLHEGGFLVHRSRKASEKGKVYCRNQAGKIVLNSEFYCVGEFRWPRGANWKGFLRLSLVTCPVALYPATSDSEKISFNQINKSTGHRIKYVKVDADTARKFPTKTSRRAIGRYRHLRGGVERRA